MFVSILKLVTFCVFEMRLVVNIYQARHAQEQGAEGATTTSLRRQLATMHLRFYGAVFVAMFLALSLADRPVLLVFILYSFWIPQIVYNAIHGTRRALHWAFVYGATATRLFIPLYLYGYVSPPYQLLLLPLPLPLPLPLRLPLSLSLPLRLPLSLSLSHTNPGPFVQPHLTGTVRILPPT